MNECCFKGSSMGLKAHTNSKTTCRFPRYWRVTTPRSFGTRRVATPRCPKYRPVVLLFVWKEFRADLNLWAINLKFSQILENYVTYNLWKCQIDSFKIDPWYVKIMVKKIMTPHWTPGSRDSPVSKVPGSCDSLVSKVPGSHFKIAITQWKSKKMDIDISNGTRMNWLIKKRVQKISWDSPFKHHQTLWRNFWRN